MKKSYFFNFYLVFSLFLSFCVYAQPGKDGSITITTANTVLNRYTRVSTNVLAGSNTVTVTNINELNRDAIGYLPAGFVTNATGFANNALAAGDLIMLYQEPS
jgi:hypothetical protein